MVQPPRPACPRARKRESFSLHLVEGECPATSMSSCTAPSTCSCSALYKALGRLEDAGDIRAEWGLSENNRRAKFYSLTPSGRRQLREEMAGWKHYVAVVTGVLEPG